jgi:hypothetical protein
MPATPKRPGRSFSNERKPIDLAKTLDLESIVKKTGRKPKAILKMATRLGVSLGSADRPKAKRR